MRAGASATTAAGCAGVEGDHAAYPVAAWPRCCLLLLLLLLALLLLLLQEEVEGAVLVVHAAVRMHAWCWCCFVALNLQGPAALC